MNIIDRVKNILITPKTEWQVINGETATPQSLLMGYVLPLAIIASLGSLLKGFLFAGTLGLKFFIISAIIAGAVTLIGVLIANGKSQAVTDTKLEELTREVREHNNFARRVPILEEQMKVANHRIADLEKERN